MLIFLAFLISTEASEGLLRFCQFFRKLQEQVFWIFFCHTINSSIHTILKYTLTWRSNTSLIEILFCVWQLTELRLGVTERNQLVYKLHHQLVTQEVQNRLLQTDLQRTHMQVDFLQEAKTKGSLRRVKTFGGVDFMSRGVSEFCKKSPMFYM